MCPPGTKVQLDTVLQSVRCVIEPIFMTLVCTVLRWSFDPINVLIRDRQGYARYVISALVHKCCEIVSDWWLLI